MAESANKEGQTPAEVGQKADWVCSAGCSSVGTSTTGRCLRCVKSRSVRGAAHPRRRDGLQVLAVTVDRLPTLAPNTHP